VHSTLSKKFCVEAAAPSLLPLVTESSDSVLSLSIGCYAGHDADIHQFAFITRLLPCDGRPDSRRPDVRGARPGACAARGRAQPRRGRAILAA
jgi:hypothetical protein